MTAGGRRARREPNRLHRSTERLEDFLAWSLGVLLVVAGLVALQVGAWVHDTAAERARFQAEDRTPVTAVVVESSSSIAGAGPTGGLSVVVRWTAADGTERTERTVVEGIHAVGETVPVWVDGNGHLASRPITAGDVTAAAVEVGALAGVTGAGVVLLLGLAAFRWTGLRYARAWEEEWAKVGPEWSGRAHS